MRIGWRAAAEKPQRVVAVGLGRDLVPGPGGNEDAIPGSNHTLISVNFHFSHTFKDEIEFFGKSVVVTLGASTRRDAGFGEALVLHGGVGAVQDAPDRRSVRGREGFLMVDLSDDHGSHGSGD